LIFKLTPFRRLLVVKKTSFHDDPPPFRKAATGKIKIHKGDAVANHGPDLINAAFYQVLPDLGKG